MTEMFGEAWLPMSVPDLVPDDDDDISLNVNSIVVGQLILMARGYEGYLSLRVLLSRPSRQLVHL